MTETRALAASSLDLVAQRANLQALARRVGLSRAEGWLPDVTVDAHAEQDGNSIEVGGGARVTLSIFDQRQAPRPPTGGVRRRARKALPRERRGRGPALGPARGPCTACALGARPRGSTTP
nr:TolC family protein [Deltaproteobacteria bacterium]